MFIFLKNWLDDVAYVLMGDAGVEGSHIEGGQNRIGRYVVDAFFKQAHFISCCKLPTAKELAQLFIYHVVRLHSFPDKIVSDGGSQFMANFLKEFLQLGGIQQGLSSAYHPQTDGQTERTNAILEQFLRAYVN